MFDRAAQALIGTWNDGLDRDVWLAVRLTDDARSDRVAAFADACHGLAPRLRCATERRAGAEPPALLVGDRIRYHAAPDGTELAPFLEAACLFGRAGAPDGGAAAMARATADPEPGLRLYVSARCPHCPQATRVLLRLLDEHPSVSLTVVDVELFPELAARDLVQAVPTVLVGRHFRSTGRVALEDLRAAIAGRGPDAAMLGRMLDGGEAAAVATMMVDAREVFPAVLDRLALDTLSARLGAMAALERVIESAPEVAGAAEPAIWDRVARAGPQAQGDLLYLIGEAGSQASLPRLAAFLESTADEDLQEAASEAMARIDERDRAARGRPPTARAV